MTFDFKEGAYAGSFILTTTPVALTGKSMLWVHDHEGTHTVVEVDEENARQIIEQTKDTE